MHCYLCFVRYTYSGSIDPNSRYIVMSAKLWVIRGIYDLLSIIHNTLYMQIPLQEARVAPLSSHFERSPSDAFPFHRSFLFA